MLGVFGSKGLKLKAGSGIRERLLKGIGAQGFSKAVHIVIRLVEVPLFLSFWGTQLYGEWLMLSAIPAYLNISDGGFTGAACHEMAIRSVAGNRNETLIIFQSTWVLLAAISIAIGLLTISFVQIMPLADWLGFSSITVNELKTVLLLLVAHVLISFQGGLLNGGFWIAGCSAKGMYLIAVMQLLEFVGLAVAVMFGGGPVHAALGYLLGRLTGTVLMWIGHRQASPWLLPGFAHASFTVQKRLVAPAFASLSFPFGNALNIQGMRLVVGLAIGPPAVAVFVPLRTLSRIIMQPGGIINRLIEPELAMAYGAGDHTLFRRIFAKSCQFALWGCLGVCFIVGPTAYWFFPIWTGGLVSMHWPTYLVLLSVVLVNGIWQTALMVPYAINNHGRIAIYYALVYGAAAFFLGYILVPRFGIVGAAVALLIVEAAMSVIVVNASLSLTGMSRVQWVKTILRPPLSDLSKAGAGSWKQ